MVDDKPGRDPGEEDVSGDPSEGVRIIGAEEAAEAMERGDVASRRSEAEPKYGDRPARPPAGPRPALRFPLDASSDPTQIERPAVRPSDPPASKPVTGPVEMPHWTEPATGEVPKVVIGDAEEGDDLDAWSSFAASTPRWRNQDDTDWDDAGFEDPADLAGEDTRIGALDTSDRPSDEDLFSFDELDEAEDEEPHDPAPTHRRSLFGRFSEPDPEVEVEDEPAFEPTFNPEVEDADEFFEDPAHDDPPPAPKLRRSWRREPRPAPAPTPEPEVHEPAPLEHEPEPAAFDDFDQEPFEPEPREPVRQRISSRNVPGEPAPVYATGPVAYGAGAEGGGGRNVKVAAIVGVGLVVLALVSSAIGALFLCIVVAAILLLCAGEYFQAVRQAGYEPLALVGVATVAAAPLAAYWRPGVGLYVVVVLGLIACLSTFVVGAGGQGRALDSVAVTMLGIVWIGLCGGFAGLMLALPHGRNLVWAAIIGTVVNDIGAFGAGRLLGTRSFSDVSPGKTVEGVVGGGVFTIIFTTMLVGTIPGLPPFNSIGHAFLLALAVSIVAPLGDLCQSAIKRDLGVKDMGTLLPGHGGVFDRFDAMLFVLPATFFLASALKILGA